MLHDISKNFYQFAISASPNFTYTCGQLRWGTRAALAYFTNAAVRDGNVRFFYGHARGSTHSTMFNNDLVEGTLTAADVGCRALAAVGFSTTPSEFDGAVRVSHAQISKDLHMGYEYVWGRKRNLSYTASCALIPLRNMLRPPLQI